MRGPGVTRLRRHVRMANLRARVSERRAAGRQLTHATGETRRLRLVRAVEANADGHGGGTSRHHADRDRRPRHTCVKKARGGYKEARGGSEARGGVGANRGPSCRGRRRKTYRLRPHSRQHRPQRDRPSGPLLPVGCRTILWGHRRAVRRRLPPLLQRVRNELRPRGFERVLNRGRVLAPKVRRPHRLRCPQLHRGRPRRRQLAQNIQLLALGRLRSFSLTGVGFALGARPRGRRLLDWHQPVLDPHGRQSFPLAGSLCRGRCRALGGLLRSQRDQLIRGTEPFAREANHIAVARGPVCALAVLPSV